MSLKGLVAIITGSSRGIGRALAIRLAQEGVKVVVNGRNEERVDQVVRQIISTGGSAIGVVGAVEEMSVGEQLVHEAIHHYGALDILINNAGIVRDKMAHKLSEEDWDQVIQSHLKGHFSCIKPAIIFMRQQKKGTIINMTSLAGLQGTIGQLNYSAAKAGIIGMTRTLAKELSSSNIQVNAIAPAALTEMTAPYVEQAIQVAKEKGEELEDYWRIGSAEDVAQFIVTLLSAPKFLTGKVFSVNGEQIGLWHEPRHTLLSKEDFKMMTEL